jgi:hypothetical protein
MPHRRTRRSHGHRARRSSDPRSPQSSWRLAPPESQWAGPRASRPLSVGATAGVRMGCAARGGRRDHDQRGAGWRMARHSETSASGGFTGMATRSLHARGVGARG